MISVKSFNLFILLLAVAAATCYAVGTKYEACDGKTLTSKINKVTVSPCSELPCQLKKGTNVSVVIDFTMNSHAMAQKATTDVHGIIAGVPVPYKTNYYDACKTAGLKCPLKPSSDNIYSAKLFIYKFDPSINLYVQWELLDQDQKDIFCFKIPVTIVS